jgi:hypothetical protein
MAMKCTTLCRVEYERTREYALQSWKNVCCILILPFLFISLLLVGIVGMVNQPIYVNEFSYLFMVGVGGTCITVFYAFIMAIGSCVEPEPILPLRRKGTVAV